MTGDEAPHISSTLFLHLDQELHPTATVENMTSGVNKLRGCIFVGHTNTDCDRCRRYSETSMEICNHLRGPGNHP
jgi:hypothetical protein